MADIMQCMWGHGETVWTRTVSPPKQNSKNSKKVYKWNVPFRLSFISLSALSKHKRLRIHRNACAHTYTARAHTQATMTHPSESFSFSCDNNKTYSQEKERMTSKRHVDRQILRWNTILLLFSPFSLIPAFTALSLEPMECDLIKMCYLPSLCFVVISVSLQRDAGTEAVLLGQAVWPKGWRWEWFVWIISRVEFTITLNKQC